MNDQMTLSISQIASALGMDRKTVSKRLEAIAAQPAGMRAGYPVYALATIVQALTATAKTQDPNTMGAFERRAWIASERDRLKLEQERGNLISRERHEDSVFGLVKICVRGLITLPDRLERDLRVTPSVVEYVSGCVGTLRDELASAVERGE